MQTAIIRGERKGSGKPQEFEVEVLYRIDHIIVHKKLWDAGSFHNNNFVVTHAPLGLAYAMGFKTVEQATEFANYVASVAALRCFKQPQDALKVPKEIKRAMWRECDRIKNAG